MVGIKMLDIYYYYYFFFTNIFIVILHSNVNDVFTVISMRQVEDGDGMFNGSVY